MPDDSYVTLHAAPRARSGFHPVRLEVDTLRRLPAFCVVGLEHRPETSDVIRTAIEAAGFDYPRIRIVACATPIDGAGAGPANAADLRLPIAVGILARTGQIPAPPNAILHGTLQGDGSIDPAPGVIDSAILACERGVPLVCNHVDACVVRANGYRLPARLPVAEVATLADLVAMDVGAASIVVDVPKPEIPAIPDSPHADPRVSRAILALAGAWRDKGVCLICDEAHGAPTIPGIPAAVEAVARGVRASMACARIHNRAGLAIPESSPVAQIDAGPHGRATSRATAALAVDGWLVVHNAERAGQYGDERHARDAIRPVLHNARIVAIARVAAWSGDGGAAALDSAVTFAQDHGLTIVDLRARPT